MKKTIFHVHGPLCRHASDENEELYIKRAIYLGAKSICFSDHAPFPEDKFRLRMRMDEFPIYLSNLRDLKAKYEEQIEVKIGLEAEWIPTFKDYYEMLKEELDFLLLGQHFSLLPNGSYTFESREKIAEAKSLADGMVEGMKTGLFEVVAHPDQIFRRSKEWDEDCEAIAREIKECASLTGVVLEQNISNMQGKKKKRVYRPEFWQELPAGVRTVCGVDAHSVAELEENYLLQQELIDKDIKVLNKLAEYGSELDALVHK